MLLMVNITRYHSKLYVRKLSFLSFCRFAETDKNDNSDKTDIILIVYFSWENRHYRKNRYNRYNRIVIGYRCATEGIVMSSYEPVMNP